MQNHNDDTIKTSEDSSLEKYTSHFIWKGCVWEGVGDGTELQHIDPHSIGHNHVSFLFSWAAQPGAWGPSLSGTCSSIQHLLSNSSDLQLVWSPTDWISSAPRYIIVQRSPSSFERHKSHSFHPSTVKVIFWYSSTGCTCYLHGCISYFDSPVRSEINIQHQDVEMFLW